MTKGFQAVYDEIDNIDSEDLGAVLIKLGMKMNATVAVTFIFEEIKKSFN